MQIISREEIYTSDILEELKKSKIIVVEGTLYPLLNRLKNQNLFHIHGRNLNKVHPESIIL